MLAMEVVHKVSVEVLQNGFKGKIEADDRTGLQRKGRGVKFRPLDQRACDLIQLESSDVARGDCAHDSKKAHSAPVGQQSFGTSRQDPKRYSSEPGSARARRWLRAEHPLLTPASAN